MVGERLGIENFKGNIDAIILECSQSDDPRVRMRGRFLATGVDALLVGFLESEYDRVSENTSVDEFVIDLLDAMLMPVLNAFVTICLHIAPNETIEQPDHVADGVGANARIILKRILDNKIEMLKGHQNDE